jgi:RNA polymerase sigma-70 factor (ECF subfamily)
MPACASVCAPPARRTRRALAVRAAQVPADEIDESPVRAGLVPLIPQLRLRALRLCGGDASAADDIVQDTIERALQFSHQYARGTNLRAWAFQVLFSVFVTRWRRVRRERNALGRLASDPCAWTVPTSQVAPDAGDGAMTRSTRRSLDALPVGFRAVIVLVDLEQRSYLDAADTLGVPVGTVMSRLHRGRKLLAERMGERATAA